MLALTEFNSLPSFYPQKTLQNVLWTFFYCHLMQSELCFILMMVFSSCLCIPHSCLNCNFSPFPSSLSLLHIKGLLRQSLHWRFRPWQILPCWASLWLEPALKKPWTKQPLKLFSFKRVYKTHRTSQLILQQVISHEEIHFCITQKQG